MSQETIALYTGILDRDVTQGILLTREANEVPIYAAILAAGGKRPTMNEKFEWQTDGFANRRTAINNAPDNYDENTTSIVVDDGTAFYANSLILFEATGEVGLVTAVATNTLTVVRGLGGVIVAAAGSVADNANVLNIGVAEGEGKGAPSARRTNRTTASNWVQTFRHAVDISGRLSRMKEKTEDLRAYERAKKLREHGRDIEHMLIFGAADGSNTDADGKNVTTSGGLLQAITSNVSNIGGAMSQAEFDAWSEKVFSQGSGEKLVVAGTTALSAVGTLYKDKVRSAASDTLVGLRIQQVLTNFGVMNFVHDRRLGTAHTGTMIAIDLEGVQIRHTDGGDTHLREDIQNPDVDGKTDEWFSEFGLQWGDEADHAKAIGITGAE